MNAYYFFNRSLPFIVGILPFWPCKPSCEDCQTPVLESAHHHVNPAVKVSKIESAQHVINTKFKCEINKIYILLWFFSKYIYQSLVQFSTLTSSCDWAENKAHITTMKALWSLNVSNDFERLKFSCHIVMLGIS